MTGETKLGWAAIEATHSGPTQHESPLDVLLLRSCTASVSSAIESAAYSFHRALT